MAPLALVAKLATRWRHLHELQIWPQDGTTCISCNIDHQMAPLALVANLPTRWRYLHCFQSWPPDCISCIATLLCFRKKRANCDISETALPITESKNSRKQTPPKYPPKPRKTHLRNHFWPLESGFSAIATYKTYVFSKSSNVPILKFFLVIPDTFSIPKNLTEVMGNFFSS